MARREKRKNPKCPGHFEYETCITCSCYYSCYTIKEEHQKIISQQPYYKSMKKEREMNGNEDMAY